MKAPDKYFPGVLFSGCKFEFADDILRLLPFH